MPLFLVPFLFFFFLFIYFCYFLYAKWKIKRLPYYGEIPQNIDITYSHLSAFKKEPHLNCLFDTGFIVHGTFMGDDPFHINNYLEIILPEFSKKISQTIKSAIRQQNNLMAKDLGNFTVEHEKLVSQFLLGGNKCNSLVWSSANSHLARVKGLLNLILDLGKIEESKNVILIGHSHAGQIFALLTQILKEESRLKEFLDIIEEKEINLYSGLLKNIQKLKLTFITMGTPVRYEWKEIKGIKIIHIINHRKSIPFGGDFKGAIFTRDGDYIQQWGVAGSDSYLTHSKESEINQKLDVLLDKGKNLSVLRKELGKKKRIHNFGDHLLIDLEDSTRGKPNFLGTIFGHGTYTRVSVFKKILIHIMVKLND